MKAARAGCLVFLVLLCCVAAADEPIRIVTDAEKRPVGVEATGWSKEELARVARGEAEIAQILRQVLCVYVLNEKGEPQLPAIGGSYSVVANAVRFTPQFPLRPGMSYRAELAASVRYTIDIKLPAPPPAPPTRVTVIYPSADTLPENQLRFYLHFSGPIAAGDAYAHVKLLKANGEEVKRAFLEIGEELWDPSVQRLTLLFDPGRVKKGLTPRAMFGPVLEEGQSYRLVVEKSWRDANGQALTADFEKKFKAGRAVETKVDSKDWKITPPVAGTRDALVVVFPRTLDRALLMRMITVAGGDGKRIDGEINLANAERRWEFRPEENWRVGSCALVVDTALEDTAGNNLDRPFEVDVFERVDDRAGPEFVRVPFEISAPKHVP